MSNTKHTPATHIGMWFDNVEWHTVFVSDVNKHIAETMEKTGGDVDYTYVPLNQAAAAPELLETLQLIAETPAEEPHLEIWIQKAKNIAKIAIKKATE